jgi:hypothetical protein
MRFQVNLSRQPFYNRRLFWLGFLIVLTITGLFGAWTLRQIDQSADKEKSLQAKITEQNQRLKEAKAKPVMGQQALSEDQIIQIEAAAFLIKRRSFSWTKMLEEFERSLPSTVRISSINYKTAEEKGIDSNLQFSVRVISKTPEDVTKMIAKMDQQPTFRIVPISQTNQDQSGDVSFDLELVYVPPQQDALKNALKKDIKKKDVNKKVSNDQTDGGEDEE